MNTPAPTGETFVGYFLAALGAGLGAALGWGFGMFVVTMITRAIT